MPKGVKLDYVNNFKYIVDAANIDKNYRDRFVLKYNHNHNNINQEGFELTYLYLRELARLLELEYIEVPNKTTRLALLSDEPSIKSKTNEVKEGSIVFQEDTREVWLLVDYPASNEDNWILLNGNSRYYGELANVDNYTTTIEEFILEDGAWAYVRCINTNTVTGITLDINGTGVKTVERKDGKIFGVGEFKANHDYIVIYNSTDDKYYVVNIADDATETLRGVVRLATLLEFEDSTDVDPVTGASLVVRPSHIQNTLGAIDNIIWVNSNFTTDIAGHKYQSLENAVTYAEANATVNNKYNIFVIGSYRLRNTVTLNNPYYSIRGLGVFDSTIDVAEDVAGSTIFEIEYTGFNGTASPLGNINIVGGFSLNTTPNTEAITIKDGGAGTQQVIYTNDIRIDNIRTGFRLNKINSSSFLLNIHTGLLSIRESLLRGLDLGEGNYIGSDLQLTNNTIGIYCRTNCNVIIDGANISGDLTQTTAFGTGIYFEDGVVSKIDNTVTLYCVTGWEAVGGGTLEFHNCEVKDCTTDVIISGNPKWEVYNVSVDLTKVVLTGAVEIVGTLIDKTVEEEALNVAQELHVGFPTAGREFVTGKGDSFTVGMLVYTESSGGIFTDVSNTLKTVSAGTVTMDNITNGALYFSNVQGLAFTSIKVTTTVATALGAGTMEFQYWNGTSWESVNFNLCKATAPYVSYGNDFLTQSPTDYQVRFDYRMLNTWAKNDPMTLGTTYYWLRLVTTSTITTSPTISKVKIGTDRTEFNDDGFYESFGKSRYYTNLGLDRFVQITLTSSISNHDLYFSKTLVVAGNQNSFSSSSDRYKGGGKKLPLNIDTSCPLYLTIYYMVDDASAGNIEFNLQWGTNSIGDDIYKTSASAPVLSINQRSVNEIISIGVSENNIVKSFSYPLEIPEASISGSTGVVDIFSLTYGRTGTSMADTFAGNLIVLSVDIFYASWKKGSHLENM